MGVQPTNAVDAWQKMERVVRLHGKEVLLRCNCPIRLSRQRSRINEGWAARAQHADSALAGYQSEDINLQRLILTRYEHFWLPYVSGRQGAFHKLPVYAGDISSELTASFPVKGASTGSVFSWRASCSGSCTEARMSRGPSLPLATS